MNTSRTNEIGLIINSAIRACTVDNTKNYVMMMIIIINTVLLGSCGSDDEPQPRLNLISITSSAGTLLDIALQTQTNLTVDGTDQFGHPIEITSEIQWSASNDIVSITQDGTLTALAVGSTTVTATVEEVSANLIFSIWDSSGPSVEIYVSDVGTNRNGPHQIIQYNSAGGSSKTFINQGVAKPQDIVFLEDQGVALVSNLGSNDINKFDIETGNLIGAFASGLNAPTRIDIGPDGLLYAVMWNGGPVKRFQLDGTFVDDFTSRGINQAIGQAWDGQGNYYVSSFNNGANGFVRKFDGSGNDLGLFINSNLNGPTDIWFDGSGNLLVNDWSGNSVKRFDSNGNFQGLFIASVSQPEGVAIMEDGNILIGASGTGSVIMYDANGVFIQELIRSGQGSLRTPNAVIIRSID